MRRSFRRSSRIWAIVPSVTTSTKKIATPSEKKVTTLSVVSPARPSPLSPAGSWCSCAKRGAREREPEEEGGGQEPHAAVRISAPMAETSLDVIIEIPKGSRNKYEYDHESDSIKLDRFLFSSVVYPTDYGFIPDTLGQDGDPLDVMCCVSEPTFPGCVIEAKPIALFRMEDDKGIDDKVLCVPLTDPGWNTLETLDDMPDQLRDEIQHFFSIYKDLEQKKVTVDGWYSREDAWKEIEASRERCREFRAH